MNKEKLEFGEIEIDQRTFYHHKNPVLIDYIDIDVILISNKVFFGKKINK